MSPSTAVTDDVRRSAHAAAEEHLRALVGRDDAVLRDIAGRLASLSTRERQVVDGLVAGHANQVIAYDLDISPRTVEVYRANVMTKMEVRSLSELVRLTVLARGR